MGETLDSEGLNNFVLVSGTAGVFPPTTGCYKRPPKPVCNLLQRAAILQGGGRDHSDQFSCSIWETAARLSSPSAEPGSGDEAAACGVGLGA